MAMIAQGQPLADTLAEIVTAYERLSDRGGRASILLTSADRRRLEHGAAPSLPAPYNEAIDGLEIGPSVGSCGTAAYRRQAVVVRDTQRDPLWADFRELAAEHRLRSCWSTPVLATDGALAGTMAIYHDKPVEPSAEEREIVELLSRTAAVAIERDRDVRTRERQLSELQTSLLPPLLPKTQGLEVSATFHPGDRTLDVGGDFYDIFPLSDRAWGLLIGDVCGHGAQAAAVTALTRHTTRAIAGREADPREVLRQVSEILLGSRGRRAQRSGAADRFVPVSAASACQAVPGRSPVPQVRLVRQPAQAGGPCGSGLSPRRVVGESLHDVDGTRGRDRRALRSDMNDTKTAAPKEDITVIVADDAAAGGTRNGAAGPGCVQGSVQDRQGQ
ncbi:MAG: PP2C family protein-serine/threonine phosphatase [Solirubrobacteraceae bacterium]